MVKHLNLIASNKWVNFKVALIGTAHPGYYFGGFCCDKKNISNIEICSLNYECCNCPAINLNSKKVAFPMYLILLKKGDNRKIKFVKYRTYRSLCANTFYPIAEDLNDVNNLKRQAKELKLV